MEDINEIINNLSGDDIIRLKGLAGELFGTESAASAKSTPKGSPQSSSQNKEIPTIDQDTLLKVSRIMGMINKNSSDDKTNLIMALKPFLSDECKPMADDAIKMLKLIDMIPLIKEMGLFK